MGKTTKIWDRKFLGKTENFKDKEEQNFEKKHLKAYIRGYDQFRHGKEVVKNKTTGLDVLVDKWHPVKQELTKQEL